MTFVVTNLIVIMMKNNSLEGENPVAEINNRLMMAFDILRGQMDARSFYVLLYLLILKRDGVLEDLTSNQHNEANFDLISAINKYITQFDNEPELRKINEVFEPTIKLVSNKAMFELLLLFSSINQVVLKSNFPTIFDNLLYTITLFQGKLGVEFSQPTELTRFIFRLANINESSKVFNPFAGIASFNVLSDVDYNYFGQEYNREVWAIGTLRLIAYNKIGFSKYVNVDSIEYWPSDDQKFDVIVSNPPFGVKLANQYNWLNPDIKTVEQFLIEKGISSLSVRGKLIAVLSHGILFRGGSELELRKKLVEKDLIETIISFPGGLFQYTGIPFVVMIISNEKRLQNKIRYIKADNYVVEKNRREKVLQVELLSNVYKSNVDFSDDIRVIDNEVISANDYNLSVNRYFDFSNEELIIQDGFRIVTLGEIVSVNRGEKANLQNGRLVKVGDLSIDTFNFHKTYADFEINELPNVCQKIESDVLILSKIKVLKPTFISCNQVNPIYINNNVVALSIDNEKVDAGYLVYELNSKRVLQYVISRMSGISMPTISIKDVLSIPILLPDLATQRIVANNALIDYQGIKIKNIGIELDELKNSLKQEYEKKVRFRKHAIGQEIFDLTNTFNLIMKIKAMNSGHLSDDTVINPTTNTTIKNCFQNMSQTINSIREMVDNIAEDYFYGKDEEVDVINFLQEFCNENNGINFMMELTHDYPIADEDVVMPDLLETYDDNGKLVSMEQVGNIIIAKEGEVVSPPKIRISPMSFRQILSNLKNNAIKHGFVSKDRDDYKILVNVTKGDNSTVKISISNNGTPLKSGMSEDSFFINDRQGNVEIKNRVEHANGSIKLEANPNAEYPVKTIMSFKDTSIIVSF